MTVGNGKNRMGQWEMEGTEWDKGKSKEKYRIVGNGRNIMGHSKIEGTGWDKGKRKEKEHNGKGEERSRTGKIRMGKEEKDWA